MSPAQPASARTENPDTSLRRSRPPARRTQPFDESSSSPASDSPTPGRNVLITGGAGFIGSHLTDHLIARGYNVRILDCLSPQVHGEGSRRPAYLNPKASLVIGELHDRSTLQRCLTGIDCVVHLAARVGVGQSMYQIERYTKVNNEGTALLLEALVKHPVRRLVVASSMSIYGEGLYRDQDGALCGDASRSIEQMREREWEPVDAQGRPLTALPTPESKQPSLASIYALSKFDQEQMCMIVGRAYNIPTVALRFFNVYGTRQALSNPYTGVLAIFAARLLAGEAPTIFEDGRQTRDFVHVSDVVEACRLALEVPGAPGHAFNVGSGRHFSVRDVATRLARVMNRRDVEPEITKRYRCGDIRHCFADISLARRILGYRPRVGLDDGLADLAAWLQHQQVDDSVAAARQQQMAQELTV